MKKKILLIGPGLHHHTINFAKAIKSERNNYSIDILNYPPTTVEYEGLPYDNIINAWEPNKYTSLKYIRPLVIPFLFRKRIKELKDDYDCIFIHFISSFLYVYFKIFKEKTNNLIGVVWGSDLLRLSEKNRRRIPKYYRYFDNIIFDTPQLSKTFIEQYPIFELKVSICYFGVMPIERLKYFKENSIKNVDSKIKLGLNPEKINISIGHNGSSAQQHILVIKSIKNHPYYVQNKDIMQFVIPLTYGASDEYIDEVRAEIEQFTSSYRIFNSFLNDEDTAHLRNSTDILIHVQKTDAFSGSMKEIFYTGGIVINGSWLNYDFVKQLGVYFKTVDKVKQVPNVLKECILNLQKEKELVRVNTTIIYDLSSWNKVISKWLEIIES